MRDGPQARFAAPAGVHSVAGPQPGAQPRALQRREPTELGAQLVGCGVGEAVHLVRGRGAGLHCAAASQAQLA